MNRTWMITGVLLVLALLIWRNFRLQQEFDRLALGLDQLRALAVRPVPAEPAAPEKPASRLAAQLRETQLRVEELAGKKEVLEKEKLDLEKQVASLTASLDKSQAVLDAAKTANSGEIPASRVAEEQVNALTIQQARVLNVNRDLNMMVLNVGARQGIKPGVHFKILRNDVVIGGAQAVDVRREVCGALMIGAKESWPQRGDRAIPGKDEYGS